MSVTKTLREDYDAFKAKLNGAAAHLVSEFDTLFGRLVGESESVGAKVADEAEADAGQLEHEAETAAQPVLQTAEAADAAAVVSGDTKA
jgi:hypothetical protein